MATQSPPSVHWERRLDQCRLALRDDRVTDGKEQGARLHAQARVAGAGKVAADAAVRMAQLRGNMHLLTEALAWADKALADARQAQDAGREAAASLLSASAWAESHRPLASIAVLLMDIDHFKPVNDRHPHRVGDAVLRQRGARAKRHDLAPGVQVAISGGLAMAHQSDDFTAVVACADPLFYEAKNQGRNRIVPSACPSE